MSRQSTTGVVVVVAAVVSLGACAWPPRGGGLPADEPQAAAEQPVGVVEQTAGAVDQAVAQGVVGAGAVVRPVADTTRSRMTQPRISAPMLPRAPSIGGRGLLGR